MKLFVWDFHGVLEKDNEYAVVEVTNKVLEEFGEKARLDVGTCRKFYGKKWGLYYKHLCPGLDDQTIVNMVSRGIEISNNCDVIYRHINPMDYAHAVLEKIIEAGHENMILSNTQPEALDRFLDAVKIQHLIKHKIGADSHRKEPHTRNSKIRLLQDFLSERNYDKVVVIGDADTDIEVGDAVGAVTYLFSRKDHNKSIKADYYISDLREVLKEI